MMKSLLLGVLLAGSAVAFAETDVNEQTDVAEHADVGEHAAAAEHAADAAEQSASAEHNNASALAETNATTAVHTAAATPALKHETRTVSIVGVYTCSGKDTAGNPYKNGIVRVTKEKDDPKNGVYNLDLTYADLKHDFIGTGFWLRNTGDRHTHGVDTFNVVVQDKTNSAVSGVTEYWVSRDGNRLAGHWINIGDKNVGWEVCVKQREKK